MDIVTGLLRSLFENAVSFVLGAISLRVLLYAKDNLPINAFWHLHSLDDVCVAISLYGHNPAEHSYYIPIGDSISYGEIMAFLTHHYRINSRVYDKPRVPITQWENTSILIGGGKSNITTLCLLAALNPPFCSRDHEYMRHDSKGLKNRKNQVVIKANPDDGIEYAYIIRTLDPYNEEQYVFLIIG